jgi:hypothetical protein
MKKIISIGMAVFSGFCVLSAFYSEKTVVDYIAPAVLVGFLTYFQFSLSHDTFKSKGAAQWISGVGAVVLFAMAVAGNTVFWLAKTNTDSARLATLERKLDTAQNDKITAIALLNNCNSVVVKGCIKPRGDDLKAKEQAFNEALAAYNTMLSSIAKQESFKIASSVIGEINQKQFLFVRAFVGSFFLELGIVYFYVLSCAVPISLKPLDSQPEQESKLEISISKETELDVKIYDVWVDFKMKGLLRTDLMPISMKSFAEAVWGKGKYGGSYALIVKESLKSQGIITEQV